MNSNPRNHTSVGLSPQHPIMLLVIGLCLLQLPIRASADLLDHSFKAVYGVSRNGIYLGDTTRELKPLPNNNWVFTSRTQAKGLARLFFHNTVTETSRFKQQGKRIIPLSYTYDESGAKDSEHYHIDFLWQKHIIHNSRLNKNYKIEKNAQDVQTFLFQIMRDLQQHQNTMTYYIASRSNAATYVLTQNGTHTINTSFKTLNTIELVSNKLKNHDQYRIWCAVDMDFLPVRIEKTDSDGNKIVLAIENFNPG